MVQARLVAIVVLVATGLALEGPHGNHYHLDSTVLDAAGTWQLRAEARGPQGTPVDFAFTVTLHA